MFDGEGFAPSANWVAVTSNPNATQLSGLARSLMARLRSLGQSSSTAKVSTALGMRSNDPGGLAASGRSGHALAVRVSPACHRLRVGVSSTHGPRFQSRSA